MYSASKQAFVSPMIVEAVKKRKSKNNKKLEQIQPKDKKEDVTLLRLSAPTLAHRPQAWCPGNTGGKCRSTKRAKAEEAERTRWAEEVIGLLLEARLPFAGTTSGSNPAVAFRCSRGLRACTIQ